MPQQHEHLLAQGRLQGGRAQRAGACRARRPWRAPLLLAALVTDLVPPLLLVTPPVLLLLLGLLLLLLGLPPQQRVH